MRAVLFRVENKHLEIRQTSNDALFFHRECFLHRANQVLVLVDSLKCFVKTFFFGWVSLFY